MQLLLTRAVAPSTTTTNRAEIWRYLSFCQTHGHTPLPGSQHTVILFATHLGRILQANTIQVYGAAVSHLHLTQGAQQSHLQQSYVESSHPRNTTLAGPSTPSAEATTTYLVQMLGLLDSDHLQTHDRVMVKAWILCVPESE